MKGTFRLGAKNGPPADLRQPEGEWFIDTLLVRNEGRKPFEFLDAFKVTVIKLDKYN